MADTATQSGISASSDASNAIELTVIIPTFNEVDNVAPLLEKLTTALSGLRWEAVFVDDDSSDGTHLAVAEAAKSVANVRLIRRIGRRGLSTAVIEGALSSLARFVAVIDGDMQHDETKLVEMLNELRAGKDLAVGTRYAGDGGTGDWDETRENVSRLATRLAKLVTGTHLSDPMSGFFMIRREAFEASMRRLSGQGFKILLDIVASAPKPLEIVEVPYVFQSRQFGESKLDSMVAVEYAMLLIDKTIGNVIPVRFFMFSLVGGLGLFVHMAVLTSAHQLADASFAVAQATATIVAMGFNFFLNNMLTYRDKRLKGLRDVFVGLISFYLVCSLGAVANVGVANFMFEKDYAWWLSGVAGVLVGAVWNYAATSVFTWGGKKKTAH